MATDATGSPTPLGIPKFNTSVDAPSGLGSNAQMDSIDTLIAARVGKPTGIATGEVPVWNGTGWDRSSVTKITAATIAPGSNGQFFQTTGGVAVWGPGPSAVTYLRKNSITDVVSSVAATDILGGIGTLGALTTTSFVRCTLSGDRLNNSGAGSSLVLEVKLGATTLWKDTILIAGNDFAAATRRAWAMEFILNNQGATNSQQMGGKFWMGLEGAPTNGTGFFNSGGTSMGMLGTASHQFAGTFAGSAAEDTSVSKTLVVNITNGVSAATVSFRCTGALVEIL